MGVLLSVLICMGKQQSFTLSAWMTQLIVAIFSPLKNEIDKKKASFVLS